MEKSREKYLGYKNRHQVILDTAIRLFNEKGYILTTTADIAREANIAEPTIYKHFDNKKDLFLKCFNTIAEQLLGEYREIYKKNLDDQIGYLKGVLKVYTDFVAQNPHKSMFLVHMLSYRDDPEIYCAFKDFMERSIEAVRRVIESAKQKGRIQSRVDSLFLAGMFVVQYFTPIALREFMDPKYLNGERFGQPIWDMLKIN